MENDEAKAQWRRLKIRDAAYSFFLWSLPEKTPGSQVGILADRLVEEANRILADYQGEQFLFAHMEQISEHFQVAKAAEVLRLMNERWPVLAANPNKHEIGVSPNHRDMMRVKIVLGTRSLQTELAAYALADPKNVMQWVETVVAAWSRKNAEGDDQ